MRQWESCAGYVLGMTLRVITWPMGFIIVAKGGNFTHLRRAGLDGRQRRPLVALCAIFGLNGAGIAFFGSYVFHGLLIYPIVRRLSGFRWSATNRQTGLLFLSLIAVVFCGFYLFPPPGRPGSARWRYS